jgi:NADH-quinone oxidoreductase subunit D
VKLGETEEFIIPIGPQHPALKEPENFTIKVDGEYVVDAKIRPGYNHRGIEKAMESRTYIQNLYLLERVCGICSVCHMTNYCLTVEEAMGLEVPARANYIRVVTHELERLHSHSLWLGVAAHEIGFDTLFYYVWRDREVVMDLIERFSGNRVNKGIPTIGGVRRDIPSELIRDIRKGLDILEQRMKYYMNLILKERTILDRAVGVGILTPHDAVALGAVGPTARASGIKSDVRADDPYLVFDEIPFNLVTHDGCDVASRVIVRCNEFMESINIIRYCLDHLPDGPVRVKVPVLMRVPEAEVVCLWEAPRGELIHYFKSTGGTMPYRYKIRSPTLGNLSAVQKMLIGNYIADIPIIIAAIDPCFSCTDRMAFVNVNTEKSWVWDSEQLRRYGNKWYQQNS